MTDKYKSLRDALDSHFAECGDVWFTEDDVLFEHESTAQDANLVHVPETDIRLIAAANPETIRALLADHDEAQARALHETLAAKAAMERVAELEAERDGWLDQHHRDSKTLAECRQRRDDMRKDRDATHARLHTVATLCASVEQERDALRAAVQALADWAEHEVGVDPEVTPGLTEARAALAQEKS